MNFNDKYRIFYWFIIFSVPASIILAYYTSWWWLLAGFLWFRVIGVLFVSIGLHRYFSHRSFKTGPKRHALLVLGSVLTGNGSPITFAAKHLHHHKHSDKDLDIHSPKHGLLHSALTWPSHKQEWFFEEKKVHVPMFILKDRLINKIHNNYFLIWFSLAFILLLIDWKLPLFLMALPAGLSVLIGNFFINCLNHISIPGSYRNFDTNDSSYNNKWIQLLETGEGYHNNHHQNMSNYNFARMPGEFDPCAWIIERFLKYE